MSNNTGSTQTANDQDKALEALKYAWLAYRQSAAVARAEQSSLRLWRRLTVGFAILGALFATIAETVSNLAALRAAELASATPDTPTLIGLDTAEKTLAAASALLLAAAAYLGREILSGRKEERWLRSRSLAEALKSLSFRLAAGSRPNESSEAPAYVLEKVDRLVARSKIALPPLEPSTQEREMKKMPPVSTGHGVYLEKRLEDQRGFYLTSVEKLKRRLSVNRALALTAGLIAVLAPILGGYAKIPGLFAWTAWATTAAAAFAGYIFAERMEYLRTSYTATAWRLKSVRARWDISDKSVVDFQHLVADTEDAISVENSSWMAEFESKETPGGQSEKLAVF